MFTHKLSEPEKKQIEDELERWSSFNGGGGLVISPALAKVLVENGITENYIVNEKMPTEVK